MSVTEDLSGRRFGRLVALQKHGKNKHGRTTWECVCDCGGSTVVTHSLLTRGATRSCGCLSTESRSANGRANRTHGLTHLHEYRVWTNMKSRCYDQNQPGYLHYGARGIEVCDRWRESFVAFLENMGYAPKGHEIDRMDTDGHYEPENCRWVTCTVNTRNWRITPKFEHDGRIMALGDWSDECGIPYRVLRDRLAGGWTLEVAISTPVRHRKQAHVA
jgi:hypothetical protein